MLLVLFNPKIGPYQVLPNRARVDLGAMEMKGCSIFPKASALLGPRHQTVLCVIQDTHWGLTPSAEAQSVYSTAPADWASFGMNWLHILTIIYMFSLLYF